MALSNRSLVQALACFHAVTKARLAGSWSLSGSGRAQRNAAGGHALQSAARTPLRRSGLRKTRLSAQNQRRAIYSVPAWRPAADAEESPALPAAPCRLGPVLAAEMRSSRALRRSHFFAVPAGTRPGAAGKGCQKGHVREAARSASQSLKEYGEEVLRNYAVIDVQDPASHMRRDADGAGLTTPPRAMTPKKRHVVCVAGLNSALWLRRRVLCPEGGVP